MPSVSYPGFYFTEQGGLPVISSPSPSIGAFEGYTKRGLIGELGFISSWSSFVRLYGDTFTSSVVSEMMTPHCVKQFFDNGGNACWINRIEGAAATTASTSFLNVDGSGAFFTPSAVGSGEGGTLLGVASTKVSSEIVTAVWGVATAAIELASISGFEQGDIIYANDGTNEQIALVYNIDLANSELDIIATGVVGNVAIGTTVYTNTRHRVSTTIAQNVAAIDTSITLTDASRVTTGMILAFNNGVAQAVREVVSKAGNVVEVDSNLGGIFLAGVGCWSIEFHLEVYENDATGTAQLTETHAYLNCCLLSEDYIVTRLAGDDNQSVLISVVIGAGATTAGPFALLDQINPAYVVAAQALSTAGADAAASAAEWEGASAATGKTGLYVFDDAASGAINFFSLPDVGADVAAVTLAADTYAQLRKDLMFIAHAPSDDEYVVELLDYRKYTLGLDSSYTALYAPWVQIDSPYADGVRINIPPDGSVQGDWSAETRSRGVHKAPGNVPLRRLRGTVNDGITDTEQGLVNLDGVNIVRNFAERGVRLNGVRTLWTVNDGRHYINIRRLLTDIRVALLSDTQWVLFEPNNDITRTDLSNQIETYLFGKYQEGALYAPDGAAPNSINGAYYVKCDGENNPPATVEQGQLICTIGVRATPPAEFIIYNLSLISGNVDISEG